MALFELKERFARFNIGVSACGSSARFLHTAASRRGTGLTLLCCCVSSAERGTCAAQVGLWGRAAAGRRGGCGCRGRVVRTAADVVKAPRVRPTLHRTDRGLMTPRTVPLWLGLVKNS